MYRLLNQRRIRQPLIQGSREHRVNTIQCVIGTRALVQSEGEFVDVSLEMLLGYLMVDAIDSTFQDRPHAFNSVGVDIAIHVFFCAVFHRVMVVEQSVESGIAAVVVGMKNRSRFDIRENRTVDMVAVGGVQCRGNNAAFPDGVRTRAFAHPNDGCFPNGATSGFEFLGFVFVAFKATDKGFVHFDNAAQWVVGRPAGFAQPLEHEPCRGLGNADLFGQLDAGDTLTGGDKQVHPINPLVERDMRAFHDGLGANGEDFHAGIAMIVTWTAFSYAFALLAMWALRAVWPALLFHERASDILIRKPLEYLDKANG